MAEMSTESNNRGTWADGEISWGRHKVLAALAELPGSFSLQV